MNLGIRIKEARLAADMTQEELAKRIGVSKNAISNYENGVSTPKVELLCAIMKHLDIDANYLYSIPNDALAQLRLSPREREVILAYRAKPNRREVVDLLLELPPLAESKQA